LWNVTEAYKIAIKGKTRKLFSKVTILTEGKTFELGIDEIIQGSLVVTSTLMNGEFEIGSAYAADLSFSLNNNDGRWNGIQLDGATVIPYPGIELADKTPEWVPSGVFIIDHPGRPYTIMNIKASDRMILFDVPLSDVGIVLPTTNYLMLQRICEYCHVPMAASLISQINMNHVIKALPESRERMSCRDAIAEIAAMAGGNAHMNRMGELEIITLKKIQGPRGMTWGQARSKKLTWGGEKQAGRTWAELGGITSRSTYGELKNAGITWGYLKDHKITWGLLKRQSFAELSQSETITITPSERYKFNQNTELITITGLTYKDHLWGTQDYSIELGELALLADDDSEAVISALWPVIDGISYTGYSAEYPGDAAFDLGDVVCHQTLDGRFVTSYITQHTFKLGKQSTIKGEAKTKQARNYKSANVRRLASVAAKAEKYTDKHLSSYKQETAQLADLMAQALGVYGPTQVKQDSGASYWYMHDKPKLEESKVLWRFDGTSLGISDDGGKTWSGGITAQSKLIMRVIETVKVRAELVTLSSQTSLEQYVQGNEQTVSEHTTQINTLTTDITAGRINLTSQTTGNLAGMQLNARSLNFDDGKSFFTITNDGHSDFIESGHYLNGTKTPNFKLKSDGSLWAQGASIEGVIKTSGIVEGKVNTTTLTGGHIAFDYDNAMCGYMGTGIWTGQGNLKNVQITHSAGSSIVIASRASGFVPYIIFSDGHSFNPNHTDAKIVVNTPIALQDNVYISNGKTLSCDAISCNSIVMGSFFNLVESSLNRSLGNILSDIDQRLLRIGA